VVVYFESDMVAKNYCILELYLEKNSVVVVMGLRIDLVGGKSFVDDYHGQVHFGKESSCY